jgi:hypothetical protein
MPLYSLIALTLSLFGATYTVIAALRSHFDKDILRANDSIGGYLDGIRSTGEHSDTWRNAQIHVRIIKRWTRLWRWSLYVPIGSFWIFTFSIAALAIYDWGDITTKVGDPNNGTQEAIQSSADGFVFITSICARPILGFAIGLNFIFSILAIFSGKIIKDSGQRLEQLNQCAVETSARASIRPANTASQASAAMPPIQQ